MRGSAAALNLLAILGLGGLLFGEFLLIVQRVPFEQLLAVGFGGFAVIALLWALADGISLLAEIAASHRRTAQALEQLTALRRPPNPPPQP